MSGCDPDPQHHPGSDWTELLRDIGDPQAAALAFAHVPHPFSVFEGPELRFVAANRLVREAVDDRPIFGLPIREAVPELAGQEALEVFERVFASGVAETMREWRLLVEVGGRTVERFDTFTVVPLRDGTGEVRWLANYVENVTEQVTARRAAEAQAVVSEQRYLAAQEIVLTLQRNLLPSALPVLPGVRLAAQYVVAEAELQAGGDWFDAVPLGDGRVALVVGDVVGHGAAASAAMAQLRPVLREALRSGTPLAEAVDRLDSYAADSPATRAATVCVVLLDPADGSLTHVSRAHPAPLVCSPDGRTRFLGHGLAGPLGVGAGPSHVAVTGLDPDETVLLYSDGLVERPGESAAEGAERLVRIAASAVTTRSPAVPESVPDRLCALVVERVTRSGFVDDITVLAAQRRASPVAPLAIDVPAESAALPGLRDQLVGWLADLGAGRDDHLAVPLAAWEAASNVVDHAYTGRPPGRLRLTAALDERGGLRILVADDGRWRERTADTGGRGLGLLRSLTDECVIDRHADGTTVALRRALGHPAVIGQVAETVTPVVTRPLDVAVVRRDPTVLRLRGPVDSGTTALLRTELLRHPAGPLVLDLEPVTFLASAGVQLLHEITRDERVRLAAPDGSPARHVLDLTGLSTSPTA